MRLRGYFAGVLCLVCWGLAGLSVGSGATFVVTTTNATGAGSLRQAILDANGSPELDTIAFAILPSAGTYTIAPTNALPQVVDPVIIDGTTQPGYNGTPVIELSGVAAGSSANGLLLLAGNSLVRGLAINRFAQSGLRLEGLGANVIQRVFLGTDPSGTVARANTQYGLAVVNSPGNRIGGTNAAEANLISGNGVAGVFLNGSQATDNHFEGNFIGTAWSGRSALGNGTNGVLISSAPGNWIGGSAPGAGNTISGNGQSGISLQNSGTRENHILGNRVGTGVDGTNALPNKSDGLTLSLSPANWIGGAGPGEGNLISGNTGSGVALSGSATKSNLIQGNFIGTDVTGRRALGNYYGLYLTNAAANQVGGSGPGAGNLISGNRSSGLRLDSFSVANWVAGNTVGTDVTGTYVVSNTLHGISVYSASNVLGGATSGAGNLCSGNGQVGIYLNGASATANVLAGNRLGVDRYGTNRLPNGVCGLMLEQAPANTVGGSDPGAGNLVSGNVGPGIYLLGLGATSNLIVGNFVGTDATGSVALGNANGLELTNAPGNWIGGPAVGQRNLFSGNALAGVAVLGSAASNNIIAGNAIGTDAPGRRALANQTQGIYLSAPKTLIGGTQPGAGNLISGNNNVGISVGDLWTVGTVIQGNWIGLQADGASPLGNLWHGIEILDQASSTAIGGVAPGAGNRIANVLTALYAGVRIRDGCNSNAIRGNLIFGNAGLGIDLSTNGATPNRVGSTPGSVALANQQQNYPVLTSVAGRFRTVIQGTLSSVASRTFLVDFYANPTPDPSGYGEGQFWLGAASVNTSAAGSASFTATFTNTVALTGSISATATDAGGNTSEFSLDKAVTPVTAADTDHDGMPDDYEVAWGFNPNAPADAAMDADGDGQTNLQEYLAGTNPRAAADWLRFATTTTSSNALWFSVDSRLGKHYTMQWSPQIPGGWQPLSATLTGLGGLLWLAETNANLAPIRFYRLGCEP
jgi:titin